MLRVPRSSARPVKRLVFVSYLGLNKLRQRAFRFDDLAAAGISVEYWNLAALYGHEPSVDGLSRPYVRDFNTWEAVDAALAAPEMSETILVPGFAYEPKTFSAFRHFSRSRARLANVQIGLQPFPEDRSTRRLYDELRMLADPAKVKLILFKRAMYAYRRLGGVRSYDLLIAAGTEGRKGAANLPVVPVHHCDYDDWVETKNSDRRLVEGRYAVFLDQYQVDHPDHKVDGTKERLDPVRFYKSLNSFFRRLESSHHLEVVIAAHPKANYDKNPYDGRRIIAESTRQLVRWCELAINSVSTSGSYPVLDKKPLVFYNSDEISTLYRNDQHDVLPQLFANSRPDLRQPRPSRRRRRPRPSRRRRALRRLQVSISRLPGDGRAPHPRNPAPIPLRLEQSLLRDVMIARMAKTTVAVLGTGSAGMHHLRALKSIPNVEAVAVPLRAARQAELQSEGFKTSDNLDDLAKYNVNLAVIATDTARHVKDAEHALSLGFDILIEKPLGVDAASARRLLAASKKRKIYVACVMRFSQSLDRFRQLLGAVGPLHAVEVECRSYLPDWRPQRPYKETYSARAEEGGVLRDLIHEIDYSGWIFGWPKSVVGRLGNTKRLGIASEEWAELSWDLRDHGVLTMGLDYLTHHARRGIVAHGAKGTIEWNYLNQSVKLTAAGQPDNYISFKQTREELFSAQMRAFLAVKSEKIDERLASFADGLRALSICDAARKSSKTGRAENTTSA